MDWPEPSHLLPPLLPWFERHRRPLPWRASDLERPHPDPYAVLVAEVMLQQTQVATVIPYFEAWMARFPTLEALASAPEEAVLRAWQGLGYYRRARNLHACAQHLHRQGWPKDRNGLQTLPGLGSYTAGAVAALAFQAPEPALDGNLFRVLARLLALEGDPRRQARALEAWLRPGLQALGPSRTLQGLMELGSLICTPQRPACSICPMAQLCQAHQQGRETTLPPPRPRAPSKEERLWLVAVNAQGHFLLRKPKTRGLLAGLWCWPTLPEPVPPSMDPDPSWAFHQPVSWTQVYSHRRESIHPISIQSPMPPFPVGEAWAWIDTARLQTLPMGRRDQRLRSALKEPETRYTTAPLPAGLWQALRELTAPSNP